MMLAIDRITSSAIAKRIELNTSTTLRMTRLPDFDCKPDVVTLIHTPTEQQKRVKGRRTRDALTLFLFCTGPEGPVALARGLLTQARDVIGHSLDFAVRQTRRNGMHRLVVVARAGTLGKRGQLRHRILRPLPRQMREL